MEEKKKLHIVIAGGSGLVGMQLTELLFADGFRVSHLGRKPSKHSNTNFYKWNPSENFIDANAIKEADFIVNLSGESIAGKRWTAKQKQLIIQSRLQSAQLLQHSLNTIPNQVKAIVCASAIGFYGNRMDIVNEESTKGKGFLADTVEAWEQANKNYTVRTVIFRLGNVLSVKGGVLDQLRKPLNFFICPFLGGGKQPFSWIHIDDLCSMIRYAIREQTLAGIFNATAPQTMPQKQFMLTLKKEMKKVALNIVVPAWVLKIILGQQAAIVLEGANVSSAKIQQHGFVFQYPQLSHGLTQLLKHE